MVVIKSRGARSRLAKVLAASAFATSALFTLAPTAFADTSSTTNGCYAWYGNTTANGHCSDPYVTVTGDYQVYGVCAYEGDQLSAWNGFKKGTVADGWGTVECSWNMRRAYIQYS
ncbi:hypothetical protein ACWD4B_22260 [Streptomyces sp. NPDC002536]